MSRGDNWIPLFWSDWYRHTGALSPGQIGCLVCLLVDYHHHGYLPTEPRILKQVARCFRRGEWPKYGKPALDAVFELRDGRYMLKPECFSSYQKYTTYELKFLRPPADVWRTLKHQVFERDDFTCKYCGTRGGNLQCDHIVPVSRGGTNRAENLATACETCNRAKGAKTVQEWFDDQR